MKKLLLPAVVVFLVAVLLVGAVMFYQSSRQTWLSDSPHEELLGVSDGGVLFNDPAAEQDKAKSAVMGRINAIQKRIKEENERVAQQEKPFVKVALLMPLTVSKGKESAISLDQIEHALQGTYTALKRANESKIFGDSNGVGLQLWLVNQGSRQDVGDKLVDQVLRMSKEEHPLVAVVGLGSSTESTVEMAKRLGGGGIPMVGAITSADDLTGLENLWNISPSNTQYAEALLDFFGKRKNLKSAIVVRDRNSDPYVKSLADAFRFILKDYVKFSPLSYNGSTIDQPATANIFAPLVTNLCVAVNDQQSPLDTVLYAGRVADFPSFAKALKDRVCKGKPLTVLTGATGFASAQNLRQVLEEGNVTVFYASSSDAVGWSQPGSPYVPEDFSDFVKDYKAQGFPPEDLNDGLVIAHHDAFATAAQAIRQAPDPTLANVVAQFDNLVFASLVRGASGRLSFPDGAKGRAVNRPIPMLQLGERMLLDPPGFKPYIVEDKTKTE
ncbi:hypothetical protein GCM10017673_54500 [Streptosporangium violaceochromogenes]|nr:hypothetical protein GCM10017673_54500 [Streptosporangium violaceochromogenes]